ncbi:MAG: class I SAM-dependent methyltransferase [Thermomicrobiales bacterium]
MTQGGFATSTGHQFSAGDWLDLHFEINAAEYAKLVAMAGFEPGWHVLDAGSGSGSYLKSLAGEVGVTGKLTALDLAPENVALVEARVASEGLEPDVDAVTGSILDVPFPEDSFDGVWCANVTQYLTDDELCDAIAEFGRVVRPGGIIALKDYSLQLTTYNPIPSYYAEHFQEAELAGGSIGLIGGLRSWRFRAFLTEAGFEKVWQQAFIIEHRAPLKPAVKQYHGDFLSWCAGRALESSLPAEEHAFWRTQLDPTSSDAIVNHEDFYVAEGQMLAVGRVPAVLTNALRNEGDSS